MFFVLTLRQTEKLVIHRCLGVHRQQSVILKILLSKNKLPTKFEEEMGIQFCNFKIAHKEGTSDVDVKTSKN